MHILQTFYNSTTEFVQRSLWAQNSPATHDISYDFGILVLQTLKYKYGNIEL